MSRIPIRIRITLVFAVVMALVLGAVGLFLYLELGSRLDESIDNGLRSRGGDVAALVRESTAQGLGGSADTALIESDESFAQVLTPDGRVVDSTPQLGGEPVLSQAELERALAGPVFFEHETAPGLEGDVRLLAAPVETDDETLVVAVGSSLGDRGEALGGLATLLLIGGPIALLLASLAGYGATAAALRPVEAMRRRAATISATDPGERLPVPEASDELRRLGETLNETLARLEAALERERRFVDDAAHELRTPLAAHKIELEVAQRYASDERELRAAIASAATEIDRLIQLAEDLLVVARSEEGDLILAAERVPVGAMFDAVVERFGARAAEDGRDFELDVDGAVTVAGDRLRIEQALTSMVDNALRYGGGEIRLWARPAGGMVELHVSDAGRGFPEEFITRAFERFSRADEARTHGGTGLGLAIVETIARAHGGTAHARNSPGGGADVWIEVPSDAGGHSASG
jgi:two-component system, OmpR family, sensor kinase